MNKILRFELSGIGQTTTIQMKKGSVVYDALYSTERKAFSIYAKCPDDTEMEERLFSISATGQGGGFEFIPIRAIIMPDGFHVFHVCEVSHE